MEMWNSGSRWVVLGQKTEEFDRERSQMDLGGRRTEKVVIRQARHILGLRFWACVLPDRSRKNNAPIERSRNKRNGRGSSSIRYSGTLTSLSEWT